MTKIYVVSSTRKTKEGMIYTVQENVFSNRKKAENYIDWLNKDKAQKEALRIIGYKYRMWIIDNNDYCNLPY